MAKAEKKVFTFEDREKAYLLHLECKTLEEIAAIIGCNRRSVWKWSQGNEKRGEMSWEERDRRVTKAVQRRIQRQQERSRVDRAKKAIQIHEKITSTIQGMTLRELRFIEDQVRQAQELSAQIQAQSISKGNPYAALKDVESDPLNYGRMRRLTELGMANAILAKTIEQDRIRLNLGAFDPEDENNNKPAHYILKLAWPGNKGPSNMAELKAALPQQDPFSYDEALNNG